MLMARFRQTALVTVCEADWPMCFIILDQRFPHFSVRSRQLSPASPHEMPHFVVLYLPGAAWGAFEGGQSASVVLPCVHVCVNALLPPSPSAEEFFTLCRLCGFHPLFRGCGFEGVRIAVIHEAGYEGICLVTEWPMERVSVFSHFGNIKYRSVRLNPFSV